MNVRISSLDKYEIHNGRFQLSAYTMRGDVLTTPLNPPPAMSSRWRTGNEIAARQVEYRSNHGFSAWKDRRGSEGKSPKSGDKFKVGRDGIDPPARWLLLDNLIGPRQE